MVKIRAEISEIEKKNESMKQKADSSKNKYN